MESGASIGIRVIGGSTDRTYNLLIWASSLVARTRASAFIGARKQYFERVRVGMCAHVRASLNEIYGKVISGAAEMRRVEYLTFGTAWRRLVWSRTKTSAPQMAVCNPT
jgi:hypothetical protein